MHKYLFLVIAMVLACLAPVPLSVLPCAAAETGSGAAVYAASDTAEFATLAKQTIEALNAGKATEMVAKLTDLETAWDAKEKTLKPKNAGTWDALDKTLDKAISALRSSKTSLPRGKAALEEFLKKLGQATKA